MNANFTVANATRLYDMLNLSDYADYRNAQSGPDDRQFFKSGNEVRYISRVEIRRDRPYFVSHIAGTGLAA